MTLQELTRKIYEKFPRVHQVAGDNTGLLCGDPAAPVRRLLVALDPTGDVIDEALARNADCILSHHPLIRTPLKAVTAQGESQRIWQLVTSGIGCICMHTNVDGAPGGMGDALAGALNLQNVRPILADPDNPQGVFGRIGEIAPVSAAGLCTQVKRALNTPFVRMSDGGNICRTVAVLGGSGREFIEIAAAEGADAYVTADCRYHDFHLAQTLGLTLIDAGHYPTENVIVETFIALIHEIAPEIEVLRSTHTDIIQCG